MLVILTSAEIRHCGLECLPLLTETPLTNNGEQSQYMILNLKYCGGRRYKNI